MNKPKEAPYLKTQNLTIRMAEESNIPAILKYFTENADRFAPISPRRSTKFYTEQYWREALQKAKTAWAAEQALNLFAFDSQNTVISVINFTQMSRGPFQACYLGFSIDGEHEGKGLMTEALEAAIHYVLSDLNFHRIMANHLLDNERSARILKRMGFVVEGHASNYLLINGQWRDHVLNALTNSNWRDNA